MVDRKQADLMVDLMRRVDRIEAGTCTSVCLKELGLLALRLSAMNSGIDFRDLLWQIVGDLEPHVAESRTSAFVLAANQ